MELRSLDDLLVLYIKERDPSKATLKSFRPVLALFKRETQCDQISQVTHDVVLQWKKLLRERSAEATVNTYLRTLRTLFNLAERRNRLNAVNPFKDISYVPEYTKLKHTADHVEIINLLGMIQQFPNDHKPNWFWEALLKVLYYTGMRRRQLVTLEWGDLDFKRQRILLRAEGSKTRREWHIPMADEITQPLLSLKEKVLERLEVKQDNAIRSQQVFNVTLFNPNYKGKQMTSEQVTGYFKRASKRYQIKLSPHRFRHTFATQAANTSGQNLKHLQNMLGHTSIKTTLGYVQSDTDSMRQMMREIRSL